MDAIKKGFLSLATVSKVLALQTTLRLKKMHQSAMYSLSHTHTHTFNLHKTVIVKKERKRNFPVISIFVVKKDCKHNAF